MGEDQSRQARRRAFVRERHPDRGGDPDAFIAGLRALDAERDRGRDEDDGALPEVIVVRRRAWVVRRVSVVVRRLRAGAPPSRVR